MKVAIIGAGLAGVAAGRYLKKEGVEVMLFEKGRGFGGRCATRRWQDQIVDHGAQYFTMRNPAFQKAVLEVAEKHVLSIDAPIQDSEGRLLPAEPRWYHMAGNSALVRALAEDLPVQFSTPVHHARALLKKEGGTFDRLICTAPWSQTLQLLGCDSPANPHPIYAPCLTAVFLLEGDPVGMEQHVYAIQAPDEDLAWSACENHKTHHVQPGRTLFIAQMGVAWSHTHLEREREEYPALIRPMLEKQWGLEKRKLLDAFGHRWRYARVTESLPSTGAIGEGIFFAGDALETSRVESAWLSGQRVAAQLLQES